MNKTINDLDSWNYFEVTKPSGHGKIYYRVGSLHGQEVTQEKVFWHENNGVNILSTAHSGGYEVDNIEIYGEGSCFLLSGWKTLKFDLI